MPNPLPLPDGPAARGLRCMLGHARRLFADPCSLISGNPLQVQTGMTLRLRDGRIRAMALDGQLAAVQDEHVIDLQEPMCCLA